MDSFVNLTDSTPAHQQHHYQFIPPDPPSHPYHCLFVFALLSSRHQAKSLDEFFGGILPPQLSHRPWSERWRQALLLKHAWGQLGASFDSDYTLRIWKWVDVSLRVLCLLAVNTACYHWFFLDDGTCQLLRTQDECVTIASMDRQSTLCQWVESRNLCDLREPADPGLWCVQVCCVVLFLCAPLHAVCMFFVNELRKMTDRYALVQSNRRKTVTNKVFVAPVALENPKKPSLAGEVRRWLNLRILAWQGVRLATLHATMDFASIESETLALLSCPEVCMSIHWLLAGWRPDFLLHYTQYLSRARNFKIKGSTTDERKTAMMQAVAPRQRQGLRRLVALARTTTTDMLVLWGADLVHLEENLLRTFLAESLGSPYERKVASYYLSQQSPDRVPPQFRFLSLVVVPALGCALGFYVYYVCVLLTIGDRAAWLWALTLVLVLLLDALLLQPMCVLAGHVWIPGLVAPDISRKQYWLHRRCRLILQRTYGQIFSARNSLVQHLNPACRAGIS